MMNGSIRKVDEQFTETFKSVNKVPTKVVCNGKGIDEDLSGIRHLVLLFPGNPGIIEYYKEFMTELRKGLLEKYPNEDIPVWGISHAGHEMDDLQLSLFPSFEENQHLYSLTGQCDHKKSFISTYIPSHIKVIGIGHSIGCKTWSEVVKQIDAQKKMSEDSSMSPRKSPEISKCFMLFPTLERMRETPNGKWFTPLLPYQWILDPFLRIIMMLPTRLHKLLLAIYFMGRSVPEAVINGSLKLFNFEVYRRSVFMARSEMDEVRELDLETLQNNVDKFYFYFGTTDKWCPLEYVEEMKARLLKMNFKICDKGFEHAFVIQSSVEMATVVCSLIEI